MVIFRKAIQDFGLIYLHGKKGFAIFQGRPSQAQCIFSFRFQGVGGSTWAPWEGPACMGPSCLLSLSNQLLE